MNSSDSEFTIYEANNDSLNRYLTNALKLAHGITPYADLSKVEILRNGKILMLIMFYSITSLMTALGFCWKVKCLTQDLEG